MPELLQLEELEESGPSYLVLDLGIYLDILFDMLGIEDLEAGY